MKTEILSYQERVYRDLKEHIRAGTFAETGKLPSLRELSANYGFSMGSIRQALQLLESEHLITPHHGRGYFIDQPTGNRRVLLLESGIHDHL